MCEGSPGFLPADATAYNGKQYYRRGAYCFSSLVSVVIFKQNILLKFEKLHQCSDV
ncbi:hypothetical protein I79_008619 [Cricetulus griseus]|uniref:Uncharacterized protein n=1 Tax=Cricetulus griseus TaxID=10029 RepID=G3HDN3_CRIGR|nr:hypothetical protein I79_008619 [Cricetulus griseus]